MNILLITNSVEKTRKYISNLLQTAWDADRKSDNRKKEKNFLTESDYLKFIDGKKKCDAFDVHFIPEIIFIVPELNWANGDVNEGYDIAREFITHTYKDKFIQIVFLSVLERKTILNIVDERNKGFVEAFPHVCLLEGEPVIKFNYYSEIHYQLIKYLAISDHGRLQKTGHEMNSVKTNIQNPNIDIEKGKTGLLKIMDELSLFKAWTNANFSETRKKIEDAETQTTLTYLSKFIGNIIDEINIKIPKAKWDKTAISRKQPYRVLIIEDEKQYQDFFHDTFAQFYEFVYPDKLNNITLKNESTDKFSIANALDILKTHGKEFDIILLDLLYKDENDNWLNFNGLDLFQLIHKVNPYAVVRIITSLPRSIVSRVVDVIMNDNEKPNTDQVLTKKYGFEALKDFIFEGIEGMNRECELKAKAKNMWSPCPKNGPFKWSGIQNWMKGIMFDKHEVFENIKNRALSLFNIYLTGSLSKQTEGWKSGELISPKKEDSGDNAVYFQGKLVNTLVHRLIVLNEALKKSDLNVNYKDYEELIKKISGTKSIDNKYLQTKLGFSIRNDKNKENFEITLVNLFPHESRFASAKLYEISNVNENRQLLEFNPELNEWFKMILIEDVTLYEIWEDLGLDYNPYENQRKQLDDGESINGSLIPQNLTLKNLRDLLSSLLERYNEKFVCEIAQFVSDHPFDENKIKDKATAILINNLLERE